MSRKQSASQEQFALAMSAFHLFHQPPEPDVLREHVRMAVEQLTTSQSEQLPGPPTPTSAKQVAMLVLEQDPALLAYARHELTSDRAVVFNTVHSDWSALEHAPQEMRNDREIVTHALMESCWALRHASMEIRGDPSMLKAAFASPDADFYAIEELFQLASEELKGNKAFVMDTVELEPRILAHASEELKGDYEIVKAAILQSPSALRFASHTLRGNADLVRQAMNRDHRALAYATESLRGDADFLAGIVDVAPLALQFATEELRAEELMQQRCFQAANKLGQQLVALQVCTIAAKLLLLLTSECSCNRKLAQFAEVRWTDYSLVISSFVKGSFRDTVRLPHLLSGV